MKMGAMKTRNNQLELSLSKINCRSLDRRQRRIQRAALWFQRMRQVVEAAVEYPPATRTEQSREAIEETPLLPGSRDLQLGNAQ